MVAALLVPVSTAGALPGDPVEWPDQPPADIPFEPSKRFSKLTFTGPFANHQPVSDTWYPSWGADDKLYSPFMDGYCNGMGAFGGYGASPAFVGVAEITGDSPETLAFRCTTRPVERAPYDGRYASASLHHDGVWYYGSYTLNSKPPEGMADCHNYCTLGPFVGFDISRDGGLTWEDTPHTPAKSLFGESTEGGHRVKLGALHVVDFGKNMEHSPDGKMYLVGHGGGGPSSHNTWVNADNVYLVRVTPSPQTVNDENAYEYYAGRGADGKPRWSDDFADIEPLLSWPGGRLGSATITYSKALDTYLLFTSAPTDGVEGRGRYDTMVLESKSITGPWRHVHYLREFGPQAYFVNAPTRFINEDGSRMWLSWSANYGNDADPPMTMKPFGSSYSWSLREFTLEAAKPGDGDGGNGTGKGQSEGGPGQGSGPKPAAGRRRPRLVRNCRRGGALRMAVRGDTTGVRRVIFRVGRRTLADRRAPFARTLSRRRMIHTRARRLRAIVVTDAGRMRLSRSFPRCGLGAPRR